MKVLVRARGSWRKVSFKVPDDVWERIVETCERYGFRVDEALRIIPLDGYLDGPTPSDEELEELGRRIDELEKELYELEGRWSPLRFKMYYSALDNENLAIQVSGLIAENKRLRRMLGLPERNYDEVERLVHYYLNFEKKKASAEKPVPEE